MNCAVDLRDLLFGEPGFGGSRMPAERTEHFLVAADVLPILDVDFEHELAVFIRAFAIEIAVLIERQGNLGFETL
jgi:hypothetical protein